MTESEAEDWLRDRFGPIATERLGHLARLVEAENQLQNLIAPSTVAQLWTRHLLDSAQLVMLAPAEGAWLDVGTGGGFPGLVVALLRDAPTILVEPRTRRADFLSACVATLGLGNVTVHAAKVEAVTEKAAVISARAVAPVEKLLHAATHCATTQTLWLLPRGRSGASDVAQVRENWAGMFHVEQSFTDATSSILLMQQVRAR